MILTTYLLVFLLNTANAGNNLNMIYTNDMEASVVTCGCAIDPGGGIVRRLNWYKQSAFSPTDTIYINSGATLFSDTSYMDYEAEPIKMAASIMADSLLAMNIDAYAPGGPDLKMGLPFFTETAKKLPVVITNSKNKGFLKKISMERGKYDVTILGVTSAKEFSPLDPIKSLKEAVKGKKKKGSIMILLADVDEKTLGKITKQVKGIDVILSSSIYEQLTEPLDTNGSVVIRLLKGGDSVGVLKYDPSKKGKERFENQIIFLGKNYAKENDFSSRIKKYEELQKAATPRVKDDF